MPSAKIASDSLELLWQNYQTLAENVDFEAMDTATLAKHVAQKSPVRPFRIAAWLGRQAFFVAAWSLWEHYTRELCNGLPTNAKKANGDSHVDWVRKHMVANGLTFTDHKWFGNANCLRNLLAHYGGRAVESRAQNLLQRAREAFLDIDTYTDGYVAIDHCHVADLELRIEDFIEDSAQHCGANFSYAGAPPEEHIALGMKEEPMRLPFACPSCGEDNTADEDSGGIPAKRSEAVDA